ncbi:hypothetical protein [Sphingomonas sp.]|uniref:hypothetical protein n=1 Tax=Sphingomonas sp. TaxID=28214 RepID=UPI0035C8333B
MIRQTFPEARAHNPLTGTRAHEPLSSQTCAELSAGMYPGSPDHQARADKAMLAMFGGAR